MKYILLLAIAALGGLQVVRGAIEHKSTRDYSHYEQYLDSLWDANPDYYLDVEMESDTYSDYVAHCDSVIVR